MKEIPCLICNINFSLIETKRSKSFKFDTNAALFFLKPSPSQYGL